MQATVNDATGTSVCARNRNKTQTCSIPHINLLQQSQLCLMLRLVRFFSRWPRTCFVLGSTVSGPSCGMAANAVLGCSKSLPSELRAERFSPKVKVQARTNSSELKDKKYCVLQNRQFLSWAMGVRRIFPEKANSGFSRGTKKDFCRGVQKWQNFI